MSTYFVDREDRRDGSSERFISSKLYEPSLEEIVIVFVEMRQLKRPHPGFGADELGRSP
jgi:hypothetical protein